MQSVRTVHIEEALFEEMLAHMELLDTIVNVMFHKLTEKKLSDWVDAQFVCDFLNIKPRTLRSYQEHGLIPYVKLGKSSRYKGQDVEALITNENTD